MIINGKTFTENELNSLLYKKNATLLSHAEVFLRRVYHLISTFTWINSQTIFHSVGNNREKFVTIFKNADVNPMLSKKIEEATAAIFKRQTNLEAIKQIAKPLKFYQKAERKDPDLVKLIELSEKASLEETEKQQFESLDIDLFKNRLTALHKDIYIKLSGSTETQINSWFDELIILSSYLTPKEKEDITFFSPAQKTLLKALEQPTNMGKLAFFIDNTSDDRDNLIAYRNTLLRNINTTLDKRVESFRNIVETYVDLEQRIEGRSQLGKIISLFKKNPLSPEDRLAILNYNLPNFETEVQAFAKHHGCEPPPPFSEEAAQKKIAELKTSFPRIDYSALLPPGRKINYFIESLHYYRISEQVNKPNLTKRERYEILLMSETYKVGMAMHTALWQTKFLYARGMYNINPALLAAAINESQEAVYTYTEQVKENFFEEHHFREVIQSVRTIRADYFVHPWYSTNECFIQGHIYNSKLSNKEIPIEGDTYSYYKKSFLYYWDEHKKDCLSLPKALDEMYIKGKYGITIINGGDDFYKFVKDTVDQSDLKNLKVQKHLWEALSQDEKEIAEFLMFVFDNMNDPKNHYTIRDKVHELRSALKFPYLNANIWDFAKKYCDAQRNRIPLS